MSLSKESMEIDIPKVCHMKKKRVSGEGLPYSPVDWPNPGDIWSWKVGTRISCSGYFLDRFLIAPSSLQKLSRRKLLFASKSSVRRYLLSKFPDADIDAFFSSFTWKVPAEEGNLRAAKLTPCPKKKKAEEVEVGGSITRKRKQKIAASKRKTRQSSKHSVQLTTKNTSVTVDLCSMSEGTGTSDTTTKDFEYGQVSGPRIISSPGNGSSAVTTVCLSPDARKLYPMGSPAKLIPEDFDNYIHSLDDILTQTLPKAPLFPSALDHTAALEELAEARKKLSSLLAMDFPVLAASNKLTELAILSSKLQRDPSLNAEQLCILKLIEETALTSKDFQETKKVAEQADKFFADMEANKTWVDELKNEYNESKEKVAVLQGEVDSSLSAIREINEQMDILKSQRIALSSALKMKRKELVHFTSTLKMVVDRLPKVVHEVQLGNSERREWELKKKKSAEREAEILAKFAAFKEFSL